MYMMCVSQSGMCLLPGVEGAGTGLWGSLHWPGRRV